MVYFHMLDSMVGELWMLYDMGLLEWISISEHEYLFSSFISCILYLDFISHY